MPIMSDFGGTMVVKAPSATPANNAAGQIVTVQTNNYLSHGPVAIGGTTNQNDNIVVTPIWAQGVPKVIRQAKKTAAEAWVAGQKLYLIVATGTYTTTVGSNQLAGVAYADAAAADVLGDVVPGTPF